MSDRRGAEARRVRPRLQVPVVSAAAGFRRPALAVSVELEGLAAFATVWCTAVPHLPGASQSQLRLVRLVAEGVGPARVVIRAPRNKKPYAPSRDRQAGRHLADKTRRSRPVTSAGGA